MFDQNTSSLNEGDSGYMSLNIKDYSSFRNPISGLVIWPDNYSNDIASYDNINLQIPISTETYKYNFIIKNDDIAGDIETYQINVNFTNARLSGKQYILQISDNDPDPEASLSVNKSTLSENETFKVTVNMDKVSAKEVVIDVNYFFPTESVNRAYKGLYKRRGSRYRYVINDYDITPKVFSTYKNLGWPVKFAPGETQKVLTFQTYEDNYDEEDESVWLKLSSPHNVRLSSDVSKTQAEIKIIDMDESPTINLLIPLRYLDQSGNNIVLENEGSVDITLQLSERSNRHIQGDLKFDGTANGFAQLSGVPDQDSDYTYLGKVNFAPNELSSILHLEMIEDGDDEAFYESIIIGGSTDIASQVQSVSLQIQDIDNGIPQFTSEILLSTATVTGIEKVSIGETIHNVYTSFDIDAETINHTFKWQVYDAPSDQWSYVTIDQSSQFYTDATLSITKQFIGKRIRSEVVIDDGKDFTLAYSNIIEVSDFFIRVNPCNQNQTTLETQAKICLDLQGVVDSNVRLIVSLDDSTKSLIHQITPNALIDEISLIDLVNDNFRNSLLDNYTKSFKIEIDNKRDDIHLFNQNEEEVSTVNFSLNISDDEVLPTILASNLIHVTEGTSLSNFSFNISLAVDFSPFGIGVTT
ncbi:hypothetical protein MJH12_02570, partial [bacterium]|nr:hypothetical protein [bacterium]